MLTGLAMSSLHQQSFIFAERCAKMTAINLTPRDLSGTIYCGNSLTGEMYARWDIRDGWISREGKPTPIQPIPAKSESADGDDLRQLALL